MSVVTCPPVGKRRIYTLKWGGEGGVEFSEWACAACGFVVRDRDAKACQKLADAHSCDAGWCPVALQNVARVLQGAIGRYVSPAQFKRYSKR